MHHLAELETELRLMHFSAKARRLSLVVASPGRARNLSSGGATSWLGRLHLPTPQPRRLHLLAGAVAPPNPTAQAVAPPGWGGCTSWCNQGPNGSLHSAHFESFQGPNCPKIKLMGSPPIFKLNHRANYD